MGEIQDAQKYNSQGIFLLLKVVGELVYHNDFKIRSRSELEQFSRATPPMVEGTRAPVSTHTPRQSVSNFCQGLESLLAFSTADRPSGVAEIEAPVDLESSMVQDVDAVAQLHRSPSGDADRKRGARNAPKVWTRDSGSRRVLHSSSDGFGLGSLRQRE